MQQKLKKSLLMAKQSMEQLHCLINCIVHIIAPRVDFRPFLFGSWDVPLRYTADGYITYFSYSISSQKYFDDYQNLYGDGIGVWYDQRKSKQENLQLLKSRLYNRDQYQFNLAQVDLYHLFYEKGNYHRKHQPHFLITNFHTPDGWGITDPYYLWEGVIPDAEFALAFCDNSFGGGFTVDVSHIKDAHRKAVAEQFEANFRLMEYPLVNAFKSYLQELIEDKKPFEMGSVESVLSQFTVLYKTKTSYAYAYLFFAEQLHQPVPLQTERVDKLIKNWGKVTFLTMKSCMHKQKDQLISLFKEVDGLYQQEKEIKEGLGAIYDCWKNKCYFLEV